MTEVTADLFDIVKRIDPRYKIFFTDKYEIHSDGAAVLKTETLDERVLFQIMEEINFEEIEKHNQEITGSAKRKMDMAMRELSEMFSFANQTSQDVTFAKTRRNQI